jgi:hypothetical protein
VILRQRIIGWVLIATAAFYLVYFLKVRVLTPGPLLEKKDWVQLVVSVLTLMIGVANVRLAAMRERLHKQSRPQDS